MGDGSMGYVMEYGCGVAVKLPVKKKKRKISPIIVAVLVIVLVLTVQMFPKIRASIWKHLLPGDAAVTAQALQTLAADLQEGENLSAAVTAFCQQILTESGQ